MARGRRVPFSHIGCQTEVMQIVGVVSMIEGFDAKFASALAVVRGWRYQVLDQSRVDAVNAVVFDWQSAKTPSRGLVVTGLTSPLQAQEIHNMVGRIVLVTTVERLSSPTPFDEHVDAIVVIETPSERGFANAARHALGDDACCAVEYE